MSCSEGLDGALTQLPDLTTFLECRDQRWQIFDDPHPHSDRRLTYGPTLTLHGEGQRNREIDSGDWIGEPQTPTRNVGQSKWSSSTRGSWARLR